MEDIRMKFYTPVVTGTPGAAQSVHTAQSAGEISGPSFRELLQQNLQQSSEVSFSKHAVKRALEHGIELSGDSVARLNQGVKLAGEKNLDDTLILVDNTAFVVNVKNNTVITALGSSALKGNVFTNIDGTVIV